MIKLVFYHITAPTHLKLIDETIKYIFLLYSCVTTGAFDQMLCKNQTPQEINIFNRILNHFSYIDT